MEIPVHVVHRYQDLMEAIRVIAGSDELAPPRFEFALSESGKLRAEIFFDGKLVSSRDPIRY